MSRLSILALWGTLAWAFLHCNGAFAQNGDVPGESQPPLPASLRVPPAPVLSPEQARTAFRVEPGLRVELVAAEPLVEDPVAIRFDEHGRLWAVEMRGFMPNVDGHGEDEAIGRIVVCEDLDDDGVMDRSTTFLDGLVLPRAIALWRGGILVLEPPYLHFWKDNDGDLEADDQTILAEGFGGVYSPEHAANGLLWGLDNWLYLADHPGRFRPGPKGWVQTPSAGGGQWGITQDDLGNHFFNTNSDQLRGSLVPPHYAVRNPNLGEARGANLRIVSDQRVWPSRMTPGVNRGYRRGLLRKDFTLSRFTGACGPLVYRGDALPGAYRGNAFVCEPCGNLVKRNLLLWNRGKLEGRQAEEGREFLSSTDERFRPVNLETGPDGALYVVDLYRGIVQHRLFVTSWLRRQILERKLETPLGLGRIWRIVPEAAARKTMKPLRVEDPESLVAGLRSPNAWIRETAQRLLVEGPASRVVPALEKMAMSGKDPIPRLHALWTLEGCGAERGETLLREEIVLDLLRDDDPRIRVCAVRLAERIWPKGEKGDRAFFRALAGSSNDADLQVRRQLLFSLGERQGAEAVVLMARILERHCEDRMLRDAALSGVYGREMLLLGQLITSPGWNREREGRGSLMQELGRCIGRGSRAESIESALDGICSIAVESGKRWQARRLLQGLVSTRPRPPKQQRPLRITRAPKRWDELLKLEDRGLARAAAELNRFLTWPGKPGYEALRLRPLNADEQARFDRGRAWYDMTCAGCHDRRGVGSGGLAPPLRGSEWVDGPDARIIRIALHGLEGKITVAGKEYDLAMPPHRTVKDDQLAAIFTYIRRAWGNEGDPVTTERVAEIRAATEDRAKPWSARELEAIR